MWLDTALSALFAQADTCRPFGADELHDVVGPPAHHNWWGVLFRTAHAGGVIHPVGFRVSRRPARRSGVQRLWVRSDIPREDAA